MKYLELFEDYIVKNYSDVEIASKAKYIEASTLMEIDECVDYVINNCAEFINNPIYITRYIRTPLTNVFPFISDPIERVSRDNSNHYTLILDNSEKWKDYPKRGRSFICTLECNKYENYNLPISKPSYLVIPKDNSKWGIFSKDDIWGSFEMLNDYGVGTYKLFEDLNKLSSKFNLGGISDSNITEMKDDILKLQKYIYERNKDYIKDYIETNGFSSSFYSFFDNNWNCNIFDKLVELLDPEANNIKLKKYTELSQPLKTPYNSEAWTDSTCIFIPITDLKNFLNKLRKKTNKKINL